MGVNIVRDELRTGVNIVRDGMSGERVSSTDN